MSLLRPGYSGAAPRVGDRAAAAVKRHQLLDAIQKATDTGIRQIL
jgi:hypothetical protein